MNAAQSLEMKVGGWEGGMTMERERYGRKRHKGGKGGRRGVWRGRE